VKEQSGMEKITAIDKAKEQLLFLAVQRYKRIYPCGRMHSIDSCFTVYNKRLLLWFNTDDDSTHLMAADVSAPDDGRI
jgi:hypothetical protein